MLVAKCVRALERTGLTRLVVAGGVGANKQLRAALDAEAAKRGFEVFYPEPELCTDNGAMIAFAAAQRMLQTRQASASSVFSVQAALGPAARLFFAPMRDSVPASRRAMFRLWRQIRSADITARPRSTAPSRAASAVKNGAKTAATSAASDE